MTISPTSPTEPEPSWQPPLRRQVTFTERIDIYNGRVLAASLPDNDDSNGNGLFSKHKPSVEGRLEAGETRVSRSRRTICCLSRRTFFALIVVAVFLLGGLLGGVAAVRISKKPDTPSAPKASSTYTGGGFPTMTHAKPIATPTPTGTTR